MNAVSTGISEVDFVLGGGLVPGMSILFGAPRGCGKSSLCLQIAHCFANKKRKVVFVTGEVTCDQLNKYQRRMGLVNENVLLYGIEDGIGGNLDLYQTIDKFCKPKPELLIVDSLQTMACDDVNADYGSASQCDAVTNVLTSWAKREKVVVLVVGHLTKNGDYVGSSRMLHWFDTLLMLDYAPDESEEIKNVYDTKYRELYIAGKNRYGALPSVSSRLEFTEKGFQSASRKKL